MYRNSELRLYRSTAPDERGEVIHRQRGITVDDDRLFQFIDETAEPGQVYYYSLWSISDEWHGIIGTRMRVEMAELPSEPEAIEPEQETHEDPEPVAPYPETYTPEEAEHENAEQEPPPPPASGPRMLYAILILAIIIILIPVTIYIKERTTQP